MDFNISLDVDVDITPNVQRILGDYDLNIGHLKNTYKGMIDIPAKWNIGLIVGGSGTGKTTIATKLFGSPKHFEYTSKSVIDDINADYEDIAKMFFSVGFSSIPCWCKPYSVLSNGEKMRVDVARSLLENDMCVFDEFTSVVDRTVAETTCIALHNAIKKSNKQFIGISCHKDIIEWLQPDWVFDTDKMSNFSQAHEIEEFSLFENVGEKSGKSLGSIII